ncbi:hypothetical protein [Idiomarina xiamenensis]|uniref:Uncharacterized protein n=1 Tax=Idiomarina xiamenensis 10-D-4 TaxID=740709 RepID=K2KY66_9GAMM|nr:hypothetical protein [Idiomarina xiamenensis]EKE87514.1 hypothetical protein A10D4_00420 [Idiomarina xiamenensis 10-D-4]
MSVAKDQIEVVIPPSFALEYPDGKLVAYSGTIKFTNHADKDAHVHVQGYNESHNVDRLVHRVGPNDSVVIAASEFAEDKESREYNFVVHGIDDDSGYQEGMKPVGEPDARGDLGVKV